MCGLCHLTQVKEKWLAVLKMVISFRPPENPRNLLCTTSNNEVAGLILSPKYCLMHKPIVAGCFQFLVAPPVSYVFLCSHGAVSERQDFLVSQGKSYRNAPNVWNCLWKRSCNSFACLNGVKDWERDVTWGPWRWSKKWQWITRNLGAVEEVHELATRDHRITLKVTNGRLDVYLETVCQLLRERFWKGEYLREVFSTQPHR